MGQITNLCRVALCTVLSGCAIPLLPVSNLITPTSFAFPENLALAQVPDSQGLGGASGAIE